MAVKVEYIDWGVIDYAGALERQRELFEAVSGGAGGSVIFCEHPHVFTLGRSGRDENLLVSEQALRSKGAALYRVERGGDITYHGPGQIVVYPVLDLERVGLGLREYIAALETAVIDTVAEFGSRNADGGFSYAEVVRIPGKTGVWIKDAGGERKLCAIGVRASRGVVMHGLALNVATDLGWFGMINPCGMAGAAVTSMEMETGRKIALEEVKMLLVERLKENLRIII